jgi:lipid-A-disaccharide synthase-like uncharacterized protein
MLRTVSRVVAARKLLRALCWAVSSSTASSALRATGSVPHGRLARGEARRPLAQPGNQLEPLNLHARDWLIAGLIGEVIFSARFVVQWIHSERNRRSSMPMAFWYLSVAGALILFGYAAYLRDPVFMIGQAGGTVIYVRNIQLRFREAGRNT